MIAEILRAEIAMIDRMIDRRIIDPRTGLERIESYLLTDRVQQRLPVTYDPFELKAAPWIA